MVFFIQSVLLEKYPLGMGDIDILVCEYCDDLAVSMLKLSTNVSKHYPIITILYDYDYC